MHHARSWSDADVATDDGTLSEKGRRVDLRVGRFDHHQVAPITLRRDAMVLVNGEVVDEPYLAPGEFTVNVPTQEVPPGHVFVMGDNRDHSFDSRTIGPVPADDVLAIVLS